VALRRRVRTRQAVNDTRIFDETRTEEAMTSTQAPIRVASTPAKLGAEPVRVPAVAFVVVRAADGRSRFVPPLLMTSTVVKRSGRHRLAAAV